jgi:hypothetical protein
MAMMMPLLTGPASRAMCAVVVAAAILVGPPAAAQTVSVVAPTAATGCQPGQVLQANGEACMPPLPPAPTTTVNILGPSAVEMSRLLAATPATPSASVCTAGQVLQGNGQACVPAVSPAATRR